MSFRSVCEARKGPSELEADILGVSVEMLGKVIDELKREIFVFMHKPRHAAEMKRVVVTDSEEDDETDSEEANPTARSELEELRQRNTELEAKIAELEVLRQQRQHNTELEAENFDLKREVVNLRKCNEEHGSRIEELEKGRRGTDAENINCDIEIYELKDEVAKLRRDIDELKKESESKKNRKFQTRCIQIAKEILNEKPMIEYRSPFLNGSELDTFFQKYRIALEV
ncbi:uncharacterized protein OCT59_009483 [Rhizophagus irregularis]|uniref:Uncharacterized protein n=2 Tax=Rhizophagus irregularis TaxID=588596 RepID=A0A015JWB2_RHIIW|nr:hypothetical protein RirG_261900 [Rhizophagus irregularis DAOM 197198w]UZO18163.1 hypothetical protein OCT59_009483 [Rhizophagus irregularis]CAG8595074.1 1256_t:CDS:2 [Rhizophagus irregularis]